MKKINLLTATFLFLLLLNSCGSVVEGLSGNQKKGSDEFLIQKKAPLILPPSFGELPEPGKKNDKNSILAEENDLSIEDIISQGSFTDSDINNTESNSSIEKSIIEKINEK